MILSKLELTLFVLRNVQQGFCLLQLFVVIICVQCGYFETLDCFHSLVIRQILFDLLIILQIDVLCLFHSF